MNTIPGWFSGTMFVLAITAVSLAGLLIARRATNQAYLSRHNGVASAVFSIVGTLYAVMLAFVVIVVWEGLEAAQDRASQEAAVLGDLLRDTGFLREPARSELQKEIREYAQSIIDNEWPAMAKGESSPRVWEEVNGLFQSFSHLQPMTDREINIHAEMLNRLNELSNHRRLRLESSSNKVPGLLWGLLVIGGIITVGFTYFLGVEDGGVHVLLTASLVVMIALTLLLIVAIDHPFGGAIRVEPDAFQTILDHMGTPSYE